MAIVRAQGSSAWMSTANDLAPSAARFRPRLQALLLATSASMALAGAAFAQTVGDAQAVGGVRAFAVGGAAGALDVPAGRQLPTGGQVVAGSPWAPRCGRGIATLHEVHFAGAESCPVPNRQ